MLYAQQIRNIHSLSVAEMAHSESISKVITWSIQRGVAICELRKAYQQNQGNANPGDETIIRRVIALAELCLDRKKEDLVITNCLTHLRLGSKWAI